MPQQYTVWFSSIFIESLNGLYLDIGKTNPLMLMTKRQGLLQSLHRA